jgi:galactokinase
LVEVKELTRLLQGGASLPEELLKYLVECYGEGEDLRYQRARYSAALAQFACQFPEAKKVAIARAPGRLDILGEHTDYNGLPVLSISTGRDVVIIYSPRKDRRINLVNASFWYPPRSFEISRKIRPYSEGNWGNYVKSAVEAVRKSFPGELRGFDGCVFGDIPSQVGMGSSTALVAASAMAILGANGIELDARDVALLLAGYSRRAAAAPAAAMLGQPGRALVIETLPFSASPIPLPEDCSFVVCNSLVDSSADGERRESAAHRIAECRLAVALLTRTVGEKLGPNRGLTFLGGIRHLPAKHQREAVESLPENVSIREAAKSVGMPASKLRDAVLSLRPGELLKEPKDGFRVRERARHVISEGRRVEQAASAIEEGDVKAFGRLMDESHQSSSRDYGISTPELDLLAAICREEGALGAKLTGGGFGGCAVALVRDRDVPEFESAIISRYYHDYLQKEHNGAPVSVVALEDAIFPCKPCAGARAYAK